METKVKNRPVLRPADRGNGYKTIRKSYDPPETARRYYEMLFNKKNARVFNEEMVQTIDKFFDCHLNVSEAARQLYIHRNTLVYRLDKVQKATGLDLRAFDDAITFKMLRMLGHVGEGQKPAL